MSSVLQDLSQSQMKSKVSDVKSGDTVRVHQKIKEGSKERVQVFEGLVIATKSMKSHTATITVRRIASGVGVEKTYLLHSPLIVEVEVVKRARVRRNKLNYMRALSGKSARLTAVKFDKDDVNIPANFEENVEEVIEAKTEEVKEEKIEAEPKEEKVVESEKKTEETEKTPEESEE